MGDAGEDADRRNGGREDFDGEVGRVLVQIGAKRGLRGVEEDEVEIGELEGEGVVEGERSVVRRLVGCMGRGGWVDMVFAQGSGMV